MPCIQKKVFILAHVKTIQNCNEEGKDLSGVFVERNL